MWQVLRWKRIPETRRGRHHFGVFVYLGLIRILFLLLQLLLAHLVQFQFFQSLVCLLALLEIRGVYVSNPVGPEIVLDLVHGILDKALVNFQIWSEPALQLLLVLSVLFELFSTLGCEWLIDLGCRQLAHAALKFFQNLNNFIVVLKHLLHHVVLRGSESKRNYRLCYRQRRLNSYWLK